jgi:putative methionine-R-sulfoxide reductase with GAF domain
MIRYAKAFRRSLRFPRGSHGHVKSLRFMSSSESNAPTRDQLRIVALRSAIPMVGFGFMDNIVMIQAGEAIDMSLGVAFGLSTLTAAGFGQCISDVAGFTCGGLVDAGVSKMNLQSHGLSTKQLEGKSARMYTTFGGCAGVVTGCLLGMTCLLFVDTERADRAKKAKELTSIFETIVDEGHTLVNADRATLWMIDGGQLWSLVAIGANRELRIEKNCGVVGAVVQSGEAVVVDDAYEDQRFNTDVDKDLGFRTKSILTVPVKGETGEVIGVIQMVNKKNENGSDGVFTSADLIMVQMLASHVRSFVRIVNNMGQDK